MIRLALALVLLAMPARAAILGRDAAACAPGATAPALLVNVVGLKTRTGTVRVELYPPTERDWLADRDRLRAEGKPFRRAIVDVPASGTLFTCVAAAAPGPWAVVAIHDPDGKRGFSAFKDGVGFPGDPKLGLSKPRVERATIVVGPGVTRARITLNYMRGLSVGPARNPVDIESFARR